MPAAIPVEIKAFRCILPSGKQSMNCAACDLCVSSFDKHHAPSRWHLYVEAIDSCASVYESLSLTWSSLLSNAGIKVVVAGSPADAKGLLLSAIRDPDPVVFFEPKMM